ncbi:MAG TPA: IS110 family transposase [Gemmatimonadaceae bacterium]|nr:IS110 family transposase [Gemmatimonadaceae bacterium]
MSASQRQPQGIAPASPYRPPEHPSVTWSQHGTVDRKATWAAQFPVHVGVDTGKTFHKLVARGSDGRRLAAVRVDVSRAGFDEADAYLADSFPGISRTQMLVGLEFAGHYGFTFADDLHRRGYQIVNVLASVTKRLKEVEDNNPRKSDDKDAAQICKLLAQGYFVSYPFLSDTAAELRFLSVERRRLAVEQTRHRNRLLAVLDLAWPEFMRHFSLIVKPTPIALLRAWPLPADLAAAPRRAVNKLAREASQNHMPKPRLDALLADARTSVALTAGSDARRAEILRLIDRLLLVREHIAEVELRLGALVEITPAAKALTTVPEIDVVCAATILAEVGNPHDYVSPRQVLKLAGMNLARKESGVSVRGKLRQTKRGRPALRRQLFLLAGRWCQQRGLARAEYEAMQARNGGAKIAAMCAIARKLVPMLLHLMQTGEAFRPDVWIGRHNGSRPASR